MTGKAFKYTCAQCGGTFVSTWTDEEAQAEAALKFPGEKAKRIVCEDCYRIFIGFLRPARNAV